MDYGTGLTNKGPDGGIDGIMDKLGLSKIYIQAKRLVAT
ncbi:restriction endonuclease [Campylobacter concisus]|nr:restriction endonuclease [Campylobacter concisus]